jgi:hypothetical protein
MNGTVEISTRGMPSPALNLITGTATKYLLLAINIGLGVVLMPFTVRHLAQPNTVCGCPSHR